MQPFDNYYDHPDNMWEVGYGQVPKTPEGTSPVKPNCSSNKMPLEENWGSKGYGQVSKTPEKISPVKPNCSPNTPSPPPCVYQPLPFERGLGGKTRKHPVNHTSPHPHKAVAVCLLRRLETAMLDDHEEGETASQTPLTERYLTIFSDDTYNLPGENNLTTGNAC